jgi:phosphoglucosamine mutase
LGLLFGTDGVRGIANLELTPELAFKLGRAGASYLSQRFPEGSGIVVGKDTRLSSDLLEHALIAGICSVGVDVLRAGIMPTPGVAFLTRHFGALGGVVISASHNPPEYNGIKFFSPQGYKFSEEEEEEIESLLVEGVNERPTGSEIGQTQELSSAQEDYVNFLTNTVVGGLEDFNIAIDCSNGATSVVSPVAFRQLGANVMPINFAPDGLNINVECGSTYPQIIQEVVVTHQVDIGLSHDGDGDRVIVVDEEGEILDGDYLMAICALHLNQVGLLKNKLVVATVMSNMGLEEALNEHGLKLIRTPVGDRHVLEGMLSHGAVLGGEQSGHIIFLNHSTTGDGILTGLQLLSIIRDSSKKLSELKKVMRRFPQVLENVKVKAKEEATTHPAVKKKKEQLEEELAGEGRILIRPSGTEPLVRVMVEAKEEERASQIAAELVETIKENLD